MGNTGYFSEVHIVKNKKTVLSFEFSGSQLVLLTTDD